MDLYNLITTIFYLIMLFYFSNKNQKLRNENRELKKMNYELFYSLNYKGVDNDE